MPYKVTGYRGIEDPLEEAMDWSREKARQECFELIPHKQNGAIHDPNSYGNEPNPPKDKDGKYPRAFLLRDKASWPCVLTL